MVHATVMLASSTALSAGLLLLACAVSGEWWALFNLLFALLGMLPFLYGSHESVGAFGSLGDLLEAVFAISVFAFPTVLHRVDDLSGLGLVFCYASNFFGGVACFLAHKMAQDAF